MAKDPAFLFYPEKFITGVIFLSDEEVGKYIRLLCYQHQHGGLIDKDSFNSIVSEVSLLRNKFVETEDGFFNVKMMEEIEKRSKKSNNLSANAKVRWDKEKEKKCKSNAIASKGHMPSKDKDINKDKVKHLNNVFLKEKEYQSLLVKNFDNNEDLLKRAIDKLDAYIPNKKGTPYKCHASAIRSWVADKVMKEFKEENRGGHIGAQEFLDEAREKGEIQ